MALQTPDPPPPRPVQQTILSGLSTASHYVSHQLTRYHSAHPKKYASACLSRLNELNEQVEDLRDDRDISGEMLKPGDGTKILCILAQLKVMKDYMDEVDRMEKGWVWVDETKKIPMGDVNGVAVVEETEAVEEIDEVEADAVETHAVQKPDPVGKSETIVEADSIKTNARAKGQNSVIGGKYVLIGEDGEEEEMGSVDGRKSMDSEFVYVDTDGEDDGMEAVNGRNNIGEQGLLTTLQKYLRALKVR